MLRVLVLACAFSAIVQTGVAAQGGAVDRVGTLRTHTGDTCVATLIDDDLLLTAAHCLYDVRGREVSPRRLSFSRRSRKEIRAVAIAPHPDFDPKVGATITAIAADAALVTLERSSGKLGPMRVGDPVYPGDRVVVGHPDKTAMPGCTVRDLVGSIFTLDCKVSLGDSGAPVFRRSRDGRHEIIGIVSAFETEDDAHTAIANEIDIGFAALREALEGDK